MPLYIFSAHHLRQILMLVFLSLWTSSLAFLSHSFLAIILLTKSNRCFHSSFVMMSDCFCSVYVVMAGSAPEGTQFDARQFDQKLNEV